MDINQIRSTLLLFAAWGVCLAAGFKHEIWERQAWKRGATENRVESGSPLMMRPVMVERRGDGLVLRCEASSTPVPTIYWVYKGERIIQGDQLSVLDESATYENNAHNARKPMKRFGSTISELSLSCDARKRLGEYVCVAVTPTGKKTKSKIITADHFSAVENPSMCFAGVEDSNQIYMWTVRRIEYIDMDVQLFCRASGSSYVTWYDPRGQQITNGRGYTILDNGDLLIKRIAFGKHMGAFTCKSGDSQVMSFLYPMSRS